MCDISTISIRALKRKAENLKKGFKKSESTSITFLQSHLQRLKGLSSTDIPNLKISSLDCLHAIAKSKGYENWDVLHAVRLAYVEKHVDDHVKFNGLWTSHLNIKGVKVLKQSLSQKFLDCLPIQYKEPTEKLIKDSELFIDHFYEIESPKKSKNTRWYHYILPEEGNTPAKLMVVFNLLTEHMSQQDFSNLVDHLSGFYSLLDHASSTTIFEKLKEDENDNKIIAVIDEIISTFSNRRTMKDCPDCYCPNPIMATECNGCGYEFNIVEELRRL